MNFSKINLMFLIIAVFCAIGIMGRSTDGPTCKLHGSPCNSDSECCNNAQCHRFAHKCQTPIDAAALSEQRTRLRHVDNKLPVTRL